MHALESFNAVGFAIFFHRINFSIGIGDEMVDGHGNRHAELFHVFNVATQVGKALLEDINIGHFQIFLGRTAVHFKRPHSGHDHRGSWREACFAAFNVEEFFSAKISAKACFSHHIISQLQGCLCCHNGVATMRDVGKRAAMHKGWIVL